MRAIRQFLLIALTMLVLAPAASADALDPALEPSAQLRFVYASGSAPAVDVYLDSEQVVSGLPMGDATSYALTGTGTREITFVSQGGTLAGNALAQQTVSLNPGLSYTMALASQDGAAAAFLYQDDTGADGSGEGSLRVANLSGHTMPIGAAADEAALTGQLSFGQAGDRVRLSPDAPSVTIFDTTGAALFSTPAIPLGGGEFYTLFVTGSGAEMQAFAVSYPLTTGGMPTNQIWLPLTQADASIAAAASSAPVAATAQPSALLPVAGDHESDFSAALWLTVGGFLAMIIAVALQWWIREPGVEG